MTPSPLDALRAAISKNQPISLKDADGNDCDDLTRDTAVLVISGHEFPVDAPTVFTDDQRDAYSLGSVYFAYLNRDQSSHGAYISACVTKGFKAVSLLQKKDLYAYLSGERESLPTVVVGDDQQAAATTTPVLGLSAVSSAEDLSKRRAADELAAEPSVKKAKVSATPTMLGDGQPRERVVRDRITILQAMNSKSFDVARKITMDVFFPSSSKKSAAAAASTSNKPSSRSAGANATSSSNAKIDSPIIIVPSALTSLITLYNAKQFFEDGVFKSTDECRRVNPVKEPEVKVQHQHKNGRRVVYRFIDNPTKLSKYEWDEVVAVFASGQAWQFKSWRWETPLELFTNTKGYYVKYSDGAVDPTVRQWNVSVLEVNRYKRHLDFQSMHHFWTSLEEWISTHKPGVFQS